MIWLITSACPNRCGYCVVGTHRAGASESPFGAADGPPPDPLRVAGEIVQAGFADVIFAGGEPLLEPRLAEVAGALQGGTRLAAFTGGAPGDPDRLVARLDGISRIVLSLDAADPTLNDTLRGRVGATKDLLAVADAIRRHHPRMGISFNTVVSRSNVETLGEVWAGIRRFDPDSWSLTLVGDNGTFQPGDSLPDRAQVERFYRRIVPVLAARMGRAELVVLPVPYPLLLRGLPPLHWAEPEPSLDAELAAEFDRIACGDHNRTFVTRHGCPLAGTDVTIGPSGLVWPCSQAPILQSQYAIGDLRQEGLGAILAGEPLRAFRERLPHPPCFRCWAPSNVPRKDLARILCRSR